jgi:hypothetical protein
MSFPYVLSTAFSGRMHQEFGNIEDCNLDAHVLTSICIKILNHQPLDFFQGVRDIHMLYDNCCFLDNKPWEAKAFIQGRWVNVTPSHDEIWEQLKLMKENGFDMKEMC